MNIHDFVLSARLEGVVRADEMAAALADAVFRQADVEPAAAAPLIGALQGSVRHALELGGPLEVAFRATAGALEVSVARQGAELWRASHPIP